MVLVVALVLGACASTPDTYSNVDSSADFSKYKTFGFFDHLATDKSDYESTESRYLKAAVTRKMNRRGLTHSANPDLKVNFYINTEEKIRARQTPADTMDIGVLTTMAPWVAMRPKSTNIPKAP